MSQQRPKALRPARFFRECDDARGMWKESGGFIFELIDAPVDVALVGPDFHHVLIQQVKLSIELTNLAPYLGKL